MTYDVVVLIEREMSEGDARRVAALHARHEEVVDYHLLVSSHPESGFGGPMALLGSTFADVAGLTSAASGPPGRASTATLADPLVDLAGVIEHSARHLRTASRYPVHVSITHGEPLLALKSVVMSAAAQEIVVVAWPETAARFLCSDWVAKARKLLKVPTIRILEHDT
ncbi:hypothetical protein HPO96_34280 [Kribbella sandramycini]|uniref:Universal stress protein family protein n=1 Tax=Kribbella sandramycini TaxID=60450 RepID=A0A7Y4L6M0_9ACTN|nr:hypothetical protein [Kribbella sandramycini]MBB6570469.1 hypothetical protein [Kribbella sandramycini]NOL45329.1 hypothetical protein [Kribbella sandramycini]